MLGVTTKRIHMATSTKPLCGDWGFASHPSEAPEQPIQNRSNIIVGPWKAEGDSVVGRASRIGWKTPDWIINSIHGRVS